MNQNKFSLKDKKVTVMGLGLNRGGLGVTRFLAQAGAEVLVTDLKSRTQLAPTLRKLRSWPIKYVLGEHRAEDFIKTDLVIQNPGVPHNSPFLKIARDHGVPIETDMGIFVQLCPSSNIIGVAGTKGKSTTASLIFQSFKAAKRDAVLAGNIGISVFDCLPFIKPETFVVLEISSWQLEGLKQHRFAPQVSVLTNVLPDHLDRYRDFQDYSQAEQLIYRFQNRRDRLVLNTDQAVSAEAAEKAKAEIVRFSQQQELGQRCFLRDNRIICRVTDEEQEIINLNEIPLLGKHNLDNVLAACAVATIYNLPSASTRLAIKRFKGVNHRLELVKEIEGVRFYNDSAATTPDACLAAIRAFDRPVVLILGGKDKEMIFDELLEEFASNKRIKNIFLLDHPAYDASQKIFQALNDKQLNGRFKKVFSMSEAVAGAIAVVKPGDCVLLSPAAASFGLFKNEFDRGRQYIREVKKYGSLQG